MTAPDDVRARFERRYSEDDVRACAKRMKFYDHQIAAAILTEYADKLAAHADLAGEVRESYTPFPQMPSGLVIDPKLGPLFDRMQMQSYAMKFLGAALAKFHPTQSAGDSK